MSERLLPCAVGPGASYWTSGVDGILRVPWCPTCQTHRHPSVELCPQCGAADLIEVAVNGRGTVVAATVNAHTWPAAQGAPFAVVVVALEDAPAIRLFSNLVGVDPTAARIGLAVRVVFEAHEDVWLPMFTPSGGADAPAVLPEPERSLRTPARAERYEHRVAVTGIGTSEIGRRLGRSELDLTVQACQRAIADAGLDSGDIDGLCAYPGSSGMPGVGTGGVRALEQVLGLRPTWHSGSAEVPSQLGGVITGMLAIAAGLCRHVLCWTAVRRDSLPTDVPAALRLTGEAQWRMPYGAVSPAHWIALAASQYLHRYGTDRQSLGWLAVSAGRHAARNPVALRADQIGIEEYLDARMITSPFGIYDCDLPCDGAYAVVLSACDAARDLARPVVRLEAVGTQIAEEQFWEQGTLTHQPNVFGPAAHLWSRTDLRPGDVDVALLYDGFTFNALTWLEALGFCGIGEGADFVQDAHRIGPGGELPLNPHGGQLRAGRSNGFGFLHEGVTQLRGAAGARQVGGAEVAVVSSGGGIPGAAMLLTVDR
ncbi:MAG: thiolase C-terminal domain-containing protein [Sporichthyaceae bacterium]